MKWFALLLFLCVGLSVAQLPGQTQSVGGTFYVPRAAASCKSVTVSSSPTYVRTGAETATTFSWADFNRFQTSFTNYTDSADNRAYSLVLATLNITSDPNLSPALTFACPPNKYNGFDYGLGGYCVTAPGMSLMVMYVGATDNLLYGIDVILSGAPFPATLTANQPPFGVARFVFSSGVTILSSGSLQITLGAASTSCSYTARTLSLKGISYSATGIFQQGRRVTLPGQWFQDDSRQLLALNVGPVQSFFFNQSGFYLYDASSGTPRCTWMPNCNYNCEVYNYDSRFLDYIGTWTITGKLGVGSVNTRVTAWIGNAIDAAGVFPVIMFMDATTGFYLGLDKLDPLPSTNPGASYWYSSTTGGAPNFNNFAAGTLSSLGCPATFDQWAAQPAKPSSAVSMSHSIVGVMFAVIMMLLL